MIVTQTEIRDLPPIPCGHCHAADGPKSAAKTPDFALSLLVSWAVRRSQKCPPSSSRFAA
jgi:hypothetical protein